MKDRLDFRRSHESGLCSSLGREVIELIRNKKINIMSVIIRQNSAKR